MGERSFSKPAFRKGVIQIDFKIQKDEPQEKRSEFSKGRLISNVWREKREDFLSKKRTIMPLAKKVFQAQILRRPVIAFKRKRRAIKRFGKPFKSRARSRISWPQTEHQRKNIYAGLQTRTGLIRLKQIHGQQRCRFTQRGRWLLRWGWWPWMVKRSPRWAIR